MVFFSHSGRPMPPTGDRPTRHLAALALVAGLAVACGGGGGSTGGGDKPKPASDPSVVSPDSLAVNIEGLPKEGPPADVTVTGPSGYRQQLSSTQTLTHLAPGVYTITAATVTDPNHPGLGRANKGDLGPEKLQRYPDRPVQTVKVEGKAASITVTYPEPLLTITIPNASGLDPTVPMSFVLVPAGSFIMGDDSGASGNEAKPAHTVTFDKAFYVARTHCTQAQWQAVMGYNPSVNQASPLHPVTNVSWSDLRDAKTGFLDRLKAMVPGYDFRLPSEAEFEYARRGGTSTAFFCGDSINSIDAYMWTYRNANSTHAVAQRKPNPWGLFDMSGNAWNRCEDKWYGSYTGAPADGSPWIDSSSSLGTVRGGSFVEGSPAAWYMRSACRGWSGPAPDYKAGFRVVMPVPVSVDKGSTGTPASK